VDISRISMLNVFFQKTNVKGFKKLFSFELTLAWGNARF